ncbi:MAG: hypothetical protein MJZ00_05235 [Paludibacteraceae bacterium]|nr:hypothetical protein [Paludibacteraceae bacterium]
MDEDFERWFRFECCYTCKFGIVDIGVRKYICQKKNQVIADMKHQFSVHKPTDCKDWTDCKE